MKEHIAHKELWLILVSFIALAWAYGLVMAPFENLDEVEHFSAIRYVAETGLLPVHDPVLQKQYHYRQEASQPPLYYILMGWVTRLLGLSSDDISDYLVSNPFRACGPSDHPYNKHGLYHNPSREAFPWDGALLTLHFLRALTPFLQVVTIIGVYAIARLIFPHRPQVAPLAAALTAFNPQFLSVASGVNNDNLVTPLVTMGLYLTLVTHQQGPSLRRSLGLGILTGLAALSKLSGLLLLVLVGLVLLETAWRSYRLAQRPEHRRGAIITKIVYHGLLIGIVTMVVSGWWFWRNWQLYGDLTALEPMLKIVGLRESPIFPLFESGLMFRSFWGQIACSFFSDRFYLFFGLLTAAGLAGLLWGFLREEFVSIPEYRKEERQSWLRMFFLASWFGIIFVGWLRWDMLTPAPGGRLLFPAITSTSTFIAYGLLRLCPAAWRRLGARFVIVLLAVVALVALRWELYPFFAPPQIYDENSTPTISNLLEATFGSTIDLLGYDAEIDDETSHLDVTFYWQARASLSQDYALAIQLTSPIPGDDSLRFNYNTWPGRGNYPTTAWLPGQIIADHYHFRLPVSDAPTQAWQLLVALYEKESGDRLPVRLSDQDVGAGLTLTTLRVPGHFYDCPNDMAWIEPVHFGQTISLIGAAVYSSAAGPEPRSEDYSLESGNPGIRVSLCWNSIASTATDYTVFVHLYDENNELLDTGDGPPVGGAFPTRLWHPGDVIADVHVIPLNNVDLLWTMWEKGNYRIGVGIYDPISGERLRAVQAGRSLPNDVAFLP